MSGVKAADYDVIGVGYRRLRQPDPRIAAQIARALGDARTVVNVGAGAGSYEPGDRTVVAVEPSRVMIAQHDPGRLVRGRAERLPFRDGAFDVAMASLTIHHWPAWRRGLDEMRRVARRQVVFSFDVRPQFDYWLIAEYLPSLPAALDDTHDLDSLVDAMPGARVEPVLVPHDCTDGFMAAYWRRPERYLEPDVRRAISCFGLIDDAAIDEGMAALARDLETGQWYERHADLLGRTDMDYGYRLVISE